jgi:hypothetical protein
MHLAAGGPRGTQMVLATLADERTQARAQMWQRRWCAPSAASSPRRRELLHRQLVLLLLPLVQLLLNAPHLFWDAEAVPDDTGIQQTPVGQGVGLERGAVGAGECEGIEPVQGKLVHVAYCFCTGQRTAGSSCSLRDSTVCHWEGR